MNRSAGDGHLTAAGDRRTGRLAVPSGAGEPEPVATSRLQAGSLISIREIRALYGLGRTAAYNLTHRPGFPAPVRISPRCYRWWAADVAAFTADLRRQVRPGNRQRPARQAAPAQDMPALHITGKVRMARRRKEASGPGTPAAAPAAASAAKLPRDLPLAGPAARQGTQSPHRHSPAGRDCDDREGRLPLR